MKLKIPSRAAVLCMLACVWAGKVLAVVADPVVTVNGLPTAQQTISVAITELTGGATINYTTDGSNPTQAGPSIASGGSLLLPQNVTLKVQAFVSGGPVTTSNLVTTQYSVNGMVAVGAAHTLAMKNDGTVWAWGGNVAGELGTNGTAPSSQPVQVQTGSGLLTGVVAVAAGDGTSFAVDRSGHVWAWGSNGNGQLGIGTTANALVAAPVAGLSGIVGIAANGNHTLALKNDGSVWAWGANASGQAGNGLATTWVIEPTQVVAPVGQTGYLQGIVAVVAGSAHSLALKNDGTVWAWGGNSAGQLGNGDTTLTVQPSPVRVTVSGSAFSGVVALATGTSNSFAMKNDGSVWAWGANTVGELGNGTTNPASPVTTANLSPAQVSTLTGSMAAVGNQSSLGTDGTVWAWGDNTADRLAVNAAGSYATLPLIVSLSTATAPTLSITAGNNQTVSDGSFTTPLTITATLNGNPVADTLVNFIVTQGGGLLAVSTGSSQLSGILQLKTDAFGHASVYFKEPADGSGLSQVLATDADMQSSPFSLFAGSLVPALPGWMYVLLALSLFALAARQLSRKRLTLSN